MLAQLASGAGRVTDANRHHPAIIVAYAVAVLLLSLNLFSWRWWVKASAIVISGLFSSSAICHHFLLGFLTSPTFPNGSRWWQRTVEPNKANGDSGHLPVGQELNDRTSQGLPISHRLGYTTELADTVNEAQKRLNAGESVEGSLKRIENKALAPSTGQLQTGSRSTLDVPGEWDLLFNGMPPVQLPDKGIL